VVCEQQLGIIEVASEAASQINTGSKDPVLGKRLPKSGYVSESGFSKFLFAATPPFFKAKRSVNAAAKPQSCSPHLPQHPKAVPQAASAKYLPQAAMLQTCSPQDIFKSGSALQVAMSTEPAARKLFLKAASKKLL
jgi:hypothetical protein